MVAIVASSTVESRAFSKNISRVGFPMGTIAFPQWHLGQLWQGKWDEWLNGDHVKSKYRKHLSLRRFCCEVLVEAFWCTRNPENIHRR